MRGSWKINAHLTAGRALEAVGPRLIRADLAHGNRPARGATQGLTFEEEEEEEETVKLAVGSWREVTSVKAEKCRPG